MPSGPCARGWCFTAATASHQDMMRNLVGEGYEGEGGGSQGATSMETQLGQTRLPSVDKQKVKWLSDYLISGNPAAGTKLLRSASLAHQ